MAYILSIITIYWIYSIGKILFSRCYFWPGWACKSIDHGRADIQALHPNSLGGLVYQVTSLSVLGGMLIVKKQKKAFLTKCVFFCILTLLPVKTSFSSCYFFQKNIVFRESKFSLQKRRCFPLFCHLNIAPWSMEKVQKKCSLHL